MAHTGDDQHAAPAAYGGDHDAKVIGDPLTMESPGDGERLIPSHGDAAQLSKVSLIHNISPKRQRNQIRRNYTKMIWVLNIYRAGIMLDRQRR